MTRARLIGLLLLLMGSAVFILWGARLAETVPGGMGDFKIDYHAARCLIEHCDPYSQSEFEADYRANGWEIPVSLPARQGALLYINLPAAFVLTVPFALLPWGPAHLLWMTATAGSLILAAFLMWSIGADYAPIVSGCLVGFVLFNSEVLFGCGNPTGIIVALCVIAAWCLLKDRFALVGVICLAVSLSIKPHDAGLIWLYFLLAGGVQRKRALQALAVTVVLSLASTLWVWQTAPHWARELHSNLAVISAHGSLNDPGPDEVRGPDPDGVIGLQTVISVFGDDPRIYNPVSYLAGGALLLAWHVRTFRSRSSQLRSYLALAAIVPLTVVVTYHRPYDAKLLLLTVPACAMLWAEGGLIGWLALLVNGAGIALTGDIPLSILQILTARLHLSTAMLSGKMLTILLARPATLILIIVCIFNLWLYARQTVLDKGRDQSADGIPVLAR